MFCRNATLSVHNVGWGLVCSRRTKVGVDGKVVFTYMAHVEVLAWQRTRFRFYYWV